MNGVKNAPPRHLRPASLSSNRWPQLSSQIRAAASEVTATCIAGDWNVGVGAGLEGRPRGEEGPAYACPSAGCQATPPGASTLLTPRAVRPISGGRRKAPFRSLPPPLPPPQQPPPGASEEALAAAGWGAAVRCPEPPGRGPGSRSPRPRRPMSSRWRQGGGRREESGAVGAGARARALRAEAVAVAGWGCCS